MKVCVTCREPTRRWSTSACSWVCHACAGVHARKGAA